MPRQTANVNDFFFDGIYKELWRKIIPDGLTKAEIGFIIQEANLKPGSKAVDIMCGYGRHTLGLARNGIHVTAIDNLSSYIKEISETAEKENLQVECLQSD